MPDVQAVKVPEVQACGHHQHTSSKKSANKLQVMACEALLQKALFTQGPGKLLMESARALAHKVQVVKLEG